MTNSVDELLNKYQYDEEIIKEYSYNENQKTVEFVVDLIEEDVNVSVGELSPGSYHIAQGKKESDVKAQSLYHALKTLLKNFEAHRDDLLEKYKGDTPISPMSDTDAFGDDEDIIEMEDDEETMSGNIQSDAKVVCQYFGSNACTVIRGLDNVRLNVVAEDMSNHLCEKYNVTRTDPIVLSIQFAPDYVLNAKVPTIHYKPESDVKSLGFGEQMCNLAHRFTNERWKEMHPEIQTEHDTVDPDELDDKLAAIKELINTKNQKQKIEIVKSYIKDKQHKQAKAYALYFSNMNVEKAAQMYNDAGGNLITNFSVEYAPKHVNYLLELVSYLTVRIPMLTENCCICDHRIVIPFTQNTPSICTRFKCQFNYVELGVCSSIPITICPSTICSDIQENANIVDILISMCYAAAYSHRNALIFDPWPKFLAKSKDSCDIGRVQSILSKIPSVSQMKKHAKTESQLIKFLDADVYELVKWIITVSRPALVKMPEKRRIKKMETEHQYMMMMDSPDKAANFKKMRQEYGSYFAYHGSSVENWHSILRKGLVNASNTKLMTTGAAYGEGIYMAPDSGTSMGYARVGSSWAKSDLGAQNLQILAICEVVKAPNVPTTPSPYYVVKQAECVTPRFFLFYVGGKTVSVMAKDLELHQYVQ